MAPIAIIIIKAAFHHPESWAVVVIAKLCAKPSYSDRQANARVAPT